MAKLVVILGAGASLDCASDEVTHGGLAPPLTKDLFHIRYGGILDHYPRVQSAAPLIRDAAKDEAVNLENFLREKLRDSTLPEDRLSFLQLPLYLQHVLHEVSRTYTSFPDNYDRLVRRLLALDEVVFVTLNYDTLFERRLEAATGHRILEMGDYLAPERKWAVVKLHGSVDWGRLVRDTQSPSPSDPYWVTAFDALYPGIHDRLDHDIVIRRQFTFVPEIRAGAEGLFYPALSAPLGPEDAYSCPPDHVAYVQEWLVRGDAVNVLLIGYSGYDEAIGHLLKECGRPVVKLAVLNQNIDASRATAARFAEQLQQDVDPTVLADAGFGAAVRSGGLVDQFVSGLD